MRLGRSGVWLFSEPGAGSDLAGARRHHSSGPVRRDGWRVEGQKVWTSAAHRARYGLLLARTDPDLPKHKGMTYFVIDMHAPGVEVRPLRQMNGESEFNEVYLDKAYIPDDWRLGEVGSGWSVAMTTLMNERNAIGGGPSVRNAGSIADALQLWRERSDLCARPVARPLINSSFSRTPALRRSKSEQGHQPPAWRGSDRKLYGAVEPARR
jgi:alkylation response protein AidB-like acyl-CoA dehydrogenase